MARDRDRKARKIIHFYSISIKDIYIFFFLLQKGLVYGFMRIQAYRHIYISILSAECYRFNIYIYISVYTVGWAYHNFEFVSTEERKKIFIEDQTTHQTTKEKKPVPTESI